MKLDLERLKQEVVRHVEYIQSNNQGTFDITGIPSWEFSSEVRFRNAPPSDSPVVVGLAEDWADLLALAREVPEPDPRGFAILGSLLSWLAFEHGY